MIRRCFIPTLNVLVRTVKPQILFKNQINVNSVSNDIRLHRSFTTNSVEFSTENLETVSFEDLKSLAQDRNVVIIDVREPSELIEDGVLPGSINIPLGEIGETLKNMSNDQFLKKYGCNKPEKQTPLVFSCRSGKRSKKAQIAALQLGYKNVKNYLGGWTEWAEKSKQ